jgi:hypothetical protein
LLRRRISIISCQRFCRSSSGMAGAMQRLCHRLDVEGLTTRAPSISRRRREARSTARRDRCRPGRRRIPWPPGSCRRAMASPSRCGPGDRTRPAYSEKVLLR